MVERRGPAATASPARRSRCRRGSRAPRRRRPFRLDRGPDAVVDALAQRAGVILDPAIVETLIADADELWPTAAAGDPRERVLEVEPEPVIEIGPAELPGWRPRSATSRT